MLIFEVHHSPKNRPGSLVNLPEAISKLMVSFSFILLSAETFKRTIAVPEGVSSLTWTVEGTFLNTGYAAMENIFMQIQYMRLYI